MSDDITLLQEQYNSIRALFQSPVESRTGLKLDAESVQNLDALLQGFEALLRNFAQELEVLRFTEKVRISQPGESAFVVSGGIGQLLVLMAPHYERGEVVLEGAVYDAIVDGLAGIMEKATFVERQLDAFRGLEAARFDAGIMEEAATDATGALMLEGKVIWPNFGGRS